MCSELLEKASQSIGFACDDLQAAHAEADPVLAIVLEVLHKQAMDLRDAIRRLQEAKDSMP